jgi:threonine aldolase
MLGKEAALFVTSGVQGNQLAILTHARMGEEIILEAESHIFYYESGAASALAGVQTRTIPGMRGAMPPEQVERAIRTRDIHHPKTALICLENTHNRAGGAVLPLAYLKAIREISVRRQVPVHMDGARLFNAAVSLNVDVKAITCHVDTVQVCLSKGLGAPVGSILAGPKDWIAQARIWRKRLGGGMRQAGVIAAPGIVALTEMVERLREDHEHARMLATALAEIPGFMVRPEEVETNIIIVDVQPSGLTAQQWAERLRQVGVLCTCFSDTLLRFVTHKDVNREQLEEAIQRIRTVSKQMGY